jgi:hypothetical protein
MRADDLAELERLFTGPLGPVPTRCLQGRFLGFLDTPGAHDPRNRAMQTVMFKWPRFGVDFARHLWWFLDPRLAAGRFRVEVGRSRWRDTEVLRLVYDVSKLPFPIRNLLYDEVKPLPSGRILGLGGINAGRGAGDHFFFELR